MGPDGLPLPGCGWKFPMRNEVELNNDSIIVAFNYKLLQSFTTIVILLIVIIRIYSNIKNNINKCNYF